MGDNDDATNNSPGKRPRTKSEESGGGADPSANANMPSKEDDVAFMKDIGWIKDSQDVEGLLLQHSTTTTTNSTGKPRSQSGRGGRKGAFESTSDVVPAAVGITYNPGRPNPFFAGAALQGGPLAQQQGSSGSKSDGRRRGGSYTINSSTKGKPNNRSSSNSTGNRQQQERPEKKDTRTHAYRKR